MRYLGFFINHRLDWAPHIDTMCNRARASIKALQVLGNTHRGLSMANWRLVFNAVCLPVLSYGCHLWMASHNKNTLVKKVQLVFNEGVKVISGAFRTAPCEPLHEIVRVLPARHYLEKLTITSALRLYRIPPTSQLRCRLGPEWQEESSGNLHPRDGQSGTPHTQRVGQRRHAKRPTALEALGERVPFEGPHADVVAVPPWEVPNWGGRVNHLGIATPQDRKEMVDGLYRALPTVTVHVS